MEQSAWRTSSSSPPPPPLLPPQGAAALAAALPPPPPLVRHAGRAHVRGKIRRIWRPRYLELLDNGYLRYYEVPPETSSAPAAAAAAAAPSQLHAPQQPPQQATPPNAPSPGQSQQQPDGSSPLDHNCWEHNALLLMIPKYALRVYQARILDPTALRDIHVGLPRGCYGFLFRGQRVAIIDHNQSHSHSHDLLLHGGAGAGGSDPNWETMMMMMTMPVLLDQPALEDTTVTASASAALQPNRPTPPNLLLHSHHHQRSLSLPPPFLISPLAACGGGGSNQRVDSPTSSPTSATTTAARGVGANNIAPLSIQQPEPQRDFLCAVSTLEEAQTWVVALQWAAAQQNQLQQQQQQQQQQLLQRKQQQQPAATTGANNTTTTTSTMGSSPNNNNNNNNNNLSLAAALGWEEETGLEDYYDHNNDWITPPTMNTTTAFVSAIATGEAATTSPEAKKTATTTAAAAASNSTNKPLSSSSRDDGNRSAGAVKPAASSGAGGGKIVVSKVAHVRLVRTAWCQWEIAYEIHILLLRVPPPPAKKFTSLSSSATSHHHHQTSSSGANGGGMVVEEWSMLRTAQDLEDLVAGLCQELGNGGEGVSATSRGGGGVGLDRATLAGPLRRLPRWKDRHTVHEIQQWGSAMSIVDSILRSLVLDAAMVNAQAMKSFLGLGSGASSTSSSGISTAATTTTRTNNPQAAVRTSTPASFSLTSLPSLWSSMGIGLGTNATRASGASVPRTSSSSSSTFSPPSLWLSLNLLLSQYFPLHEPQSVLSKSIETLSEQTSTDQYVKQWMQQTRSPAASSASSLSPSSALLYLSSSSSPFWCLEESYYYHVWTQRPWTWLSGLGTLVATTTLIGPTLWRQYSQSMPHVSVRLDYLVVSWVGAAYLGQHIIIIQNANTTKSKTESTTQETPKGRTSPTGNDQPNNSQSNLTAGRPEQPASSVLSVQSGESNISDLSAVLVGERGSRTGKDDESGGVVVNAAGEEEEEDSDGEETTPAVPFEAVGGAAALSSPLPQHSSPDGGGHSCWSQPEAGIFYVRSTTYLKDRVKLPSGPAAFACRGVDMWMTDTPLRHIARHPAVLGGRLGQEDTFLVNFLLPFGNLVAYFAIPPLHQFPNKKLRTVWTKFLRGDQQYRDARLKLLPVVVSGPWIVKVAVGPGKSPALLGKGIPLQYFFRDADPKHPTSKKAVYEVDVIITASTIAKGILSVVKNHTHSVSIAFAFIIEASQQEELPESILCCFQIHALHLEDCPVLPECDLDQVTSY